MKWTKDQLSAIESSGMSIVSASAGTGKTAVLTEKVIRALDNENIGFEDLLVITFSKASAIEMKIRIKKVLEEKIALDQDENVDKYKREILKVDRAYIQTIHAFCKSILDEYGYTIGLKANLKVQSFVDQEIVKNKIMSTLTGKYSNGEKREILKNFSRTLDMPSNLAKELIYAYDKVMLQIDPVKFLEMSIKNTSDKEIIEGLIFEKIKKDLDESLVIYMDLYKDISDINDEKMSKNINGISEELEALEDIISNNLYTDSLKFNNSLSIFKQTLRFPKEYSALKDKRDLAREIVNKYTDFDLKKETDIVLKSSLTVKLISEIILEFNDIYQLYKKENGLIDFSDMERYAMEILKNDKISSKYKERFKMIFVDEYQDTSMVQEHIINSIAKEDNLFCVGDYKQSIYGFRSSDPTIFKNRINNKNATVYFLKDNFRSERNIVNSINDIFRYIDDSTSKMSYEKEEELNYGLSDSFNEIVKLSLVNNESKLENDYVEAKNICKTIEENLEKEFLNIDTGEKKKLNYSDFAVVTRKLSGLSEYLERAFKEARIPYVIEKTDSLLNNPEIQLFINLLKIVDKEDNDVAIISVMHAGLFGLNDNDLVELKLKEKNKKLCESFNLELKDNVRYKEVANFLEEVENITNLTDKVNFALVKSNIKEFIYTLDNANEKLSNIDFFIDFINEYSVDKSDNLSCFLRYIEDIERLGIRIDEPRPINRDCVTITTIHKSKGLEYPFVIAPYLSKQFLKVDTARPIIVDNELGVSASIYDDGKKIDSINKKISAEKVQAKGVEEELRLLYVLLTRAKNALIMQGKNITPNTQKANSLMDFILGAYYNGNLNGNWIKEEHIYQDTENLEKQVTIPYTKLLMEIINA